MFYWIFYCKSLEASGEGNAVVAGSPDTFTHLLELVTTALDEFESVSVAASARRAMRIARLHGDGPDAFRFALELGLAYVGDSPDVGTDLDWMNGVITSFRQTRTTPIDANFLGLTTPGPVTFDQGLDDLVFGLEPRPYEKAISLSTQMELHNKRVAVEQIIAAVKNYIFRYLIDLETELRVSATGERIFERGRFRVVRLLRSRAPGVLDGLTSAIRRAHERSDSESRSHALTSCRRVLVAVADVVMPATDEIYIDAKGQERRLKPGQYRNRILAALERAKGDTHVAAVAAAFDDMANRLEKLDALTQKGVHGKVTAEEMDFAVIQTYLLASEILRLTVDVD